MNRYLAIALFALSAPIAGYAEGEAPAAQPSEPAPAPPACVKPDTSVSVSKKEDAEAFNLKTSTYRNCIQAYLSAQKADAEQHAAAANAAIRDFNAFSAELNAKFGPTKPKEQ